MELSTATIYTINNFLLNVRNPIKIKYPSILFLSIINLGAMTWLCYRYIENRTIVRHAIMRWNCIMNASHTVSSKKDINNQINIHVSPKS